MSRKGRAPKRDVIPDLKYKDAPIEVRKRITKFINKIMWDGKRGTAERIVYGAFEIIAERRKDDPVKIFEKAIDNVRPHIEVKSRRVGGSTYQVPVEVEFNRSIALAMRWIIHSSRNRSEHSMKERLASELMEAAEGRGSAVKKREDTHRMAEANKAFAHYRW